ncbi:helix-turn-helix domain-containing protein [Streptomyces canus]|uniref:helix-turn-helix domain-containing protein n=1 Tax=Streptomyces canus TaxID=58343 RepID=UPI002253F165|nr:helix-turn-helix transcriptional regulator [Streptomyces canus]MCX4858373.1 helix-turn-helix transcriptional regulator [Streptomyces canus]
MEVRVAGRPVRPVPADAPRRVQEFALRLRELRAAQGLTLRELSRLTMIPVSTLSDAFAGRRIPTWQAVAAIARATKADEQELRALWEAARAAREAEAPGRPVSPVPADAPRYVQELATRLRDLRTAENLTLRQLNRLTTIPMSTLSDAFAGDRVPSWQVVAAIARATKADEQELRALWEAARAAREAQARGTKAIGRAALGAPPSGANRLMEAAARETRQRTVVHDLYRLAGRPSVRELADATGLSRSAVHRTVSGQSTAGARRVADGLAARLTPDEREEWTAKITNVFEEAASGTEDTAPFRAIHASEREMVAEAFSEFERSLQHVRNLIAHGVAQTPREISAQVMLLAASMEQARSGRSPDTSAPIAAQVLAAQYEKRVQEQSSDEAPSSDPASDRKGET